MLIPSSIEYVADSCIQYHLEPLILISRDVTKELGSSSQPKAKEALELSVFSVQGGAISQTIQSIH